MRKILLLFLFIMALSVPSFGQQVAIPYRDGTQWGLSDRDGKFIIEPKFDSLSFGNGYGNKPGDMISWLKGKKGLITGGRELLAPEYSSIISTADFIRAEKTTPESILTYIYDNEGTSLYPEGVMQIGLMVDERAYDKDGSDKVMILQVTGANKLESIFVWSVRAKAVVQWLAKDVYSATLESVKGQNYAMVRIREKENSPVKISRFTFGNDGRFHSANEKREIPADKQRDGYDVVMPYERGYDGDISIDGPVGDIDMRMASPEPSGSYGGSGTGTGTGSGRGGGPVTLGVATATVKTVNVYRNYKKETDGSLVIEQRDGNGKTQKLGIKFIPNTFALKNFTSSKRVGDTVYYYGTYAVYTYKGRSGILRDGQNKRGAEYDELTDVQYTPQKSGKRSLVFIAGNRDRKSKSMKYGVVDMEGKEVIPVVYDELTVAATSLSPGYDLLAKQNGKYQVMTVEGTVLLTDIDEVKNRNQEGKPYLELQRGGKYGVFLRMNGENPFKIEPLFPYPVKRLQLAYPAQNLWMSRPGSSDKHMVLVELMDANGNTKGFAREDGFLYFKN